jgi:hypothetical protein
MPIHGSSLRDSTRGDDRSGYKPIAPTGLWNVGSLVRKFDFHDVLRHGYAGIVVVVAFGLYVKTLSPTVSFFDSGELISAAYSLGVAHPPGYPLYVLLGWLFAHLPVGSNVAYRLNLMSAFFATLAALMVYYITYTLIACARPGLRGASKPAGAAAERMIYPIISMAAAFLFAFSVTPWQHAIIAEVYSLNAFFCGLIVLLLLKWRLANDLTPGYSPSRLRAMGEEAGNPPSRSSHEVEMEAGRGRVQKTWLLYLIAFLFGLGSGNHQTILVFAPAACLLVIWTRPRIMLRLKTLGLIVVFTLLGLSIYLLVPVFAARKPAINWGNPVTWRGLRWLVTREGYDNVASGRGLALLWEELLGKENPPSPSLEKGGESKEGETLTGFDRIVQVVRNSLFFNQLRTFNPLREFQIWGVFLALAGLGYCLAVNRIPGVAMLTAVVSLVGVMVVFGDPPPENVFLLEEFFTPAYLLVAVWIGLGMMAIVRACLWVAAPQLVVQYAAIFVFSGLSLLPSGAQIMTNLKTVNRHDNWVAYDYAHNLLDSLEPKAILFTWGDSGAFPLWYLQFVEGQRTDVALIHVPHLSTDWYVELLPQNLFAAPDPFARSGGDLTLLIDEIVRKYEGQRPIYFDYSSAHSLNVPYQLLPYGLTYKVATEGDALDETVWQRYRFRGILSFMLSARSLDQLRNNGMPETLLAALSPLKDREIERESEFLQSVASYIGGSAMMTYRDLLLTYATFHPYIALDPDIRRTFSMYGSARVELGNFFLQMKDVKKAAEHFNWAVRFDDRLGGDVVQLLNNYEQMSREPLLQVQPTPAPVNEQFTSKVP